MIVLRPDQRELVERVRGEYRSGARSVVMQGATGFGKTTTASEIIRSAIARGRRVVFAAHLDALLDDTSQRLTAAGIDHGIIQADRPTNAAAPVQIASLATLHRRGERPPADLFIVDECHRAAAASVREVLGSYPDAKLLGLTATPERGDGAPLGDVFERLVCGPSVRELTRAGLLAPAVVLSPPTPKDGSLAMDPVDAYAKHAAGLPAMIFCATADEARDVAARLASLTIYFSPLDEVTNTITASPGVATALVLGDTPREERRAARDRLARGEPLVLVGCGVFLEGWDSPQIRAVILARAFGTCGAYLQGCGRGLRAAPGKTHALILDLSGAAVLHGLPEDDRVWSLAGAASRRSVEALAPLVRCRGCLAIFHAGPRECPRCGEWTTGAHVPRRAKRVELQELGRLDERSQEQRDAAAIGIIERRLYRCGRFPRWRVPSIARSIFARSRRKAATA